MKKTYIGFAGLSLLLLLGTQTVHAQQGFGTDKPHRSAAVDIQSSKRGLLIPRVNLTSIKDAVTITKPAQSLMVYNQATTTGEGLVTPGYYYWDTDRWVRFAQQGDITAINLKGDVTGPTNATVVGAIQGVEVSNVNPTANQVLTFVPGTGTEKGKWVPTSITPDVITEGKDVTAGSNKVSLSVGAKGASLKEYTVDIVEANIKLENLGGELPVNKLVKGQDGQVLVTKGGISTWVSQTEIVPTTTNTLTKKTTGEGANQTVDQNTIVSTVNGKPAEVRVIDNVTNTVTGSSIVTTVNGVASTSVDLTDAIQAGQKTVEVVNGTNTTVTKTPETGDSKHTKYAVNVSNEAIQAAQKLTTVSQGAGVKVTPTTKEGSSNTDYNVAINTDGGNAGDVLTVVKDGDTNTKVEWKKPEEYKNIYNSDGTLTANRTVNLDGKSLSFINKADKNDSKVHINQNGFEFSMNVSSKGRSTLQVGSNDESNSRMYIFQDPNQVGQISAAGKRAGLQFNSNVDQGGVNAGIGFSLDRRLRVSLDNKNTFTVGMLTLNGNEPELNEVKPAVDKFNSFNVKFGHVKIEEINVLQGSSIDKVVVADNTGVLKTVTATMPKVFYMPPILFDTSVLGDKPVLDLHAEYVKQFKVSDNKLRSANSPIDIPTLGANELYYYITHYDSNVLDIKGISSDGKLTYSVKNNATPATFMTIVFVVK